MIYAIIIAFYINFPTKRDKYKTLQSNFCYFLLVYVNYLSLWYAMQHTLLPIMMVGKEEELITP